MSRQMLKDRVFYPGERLHESSMLSFVKRVDSVVQKGRVYQYAEFKCDCGIVGSYKLHNIVSGQRSCGCLKNNGKRQAKPYKASTDPYNGFWVVYNNFIRGVQLVC